MMIYLNQNVISSTFFHYKFLILDYFAFNLFHIYMYMCVCVRVCVIYKRLFWR